jgi:hypothetical protein
MSEFDGTSVSSTNGTLTFTPRVEAFGAVVACEPFKQKSVSKVVKGGMMAPQQKFALAELQVVFPNQKVGPGSIFVRADAYALPWGKTEYEVEGKTFILVPESEILLVKEYVGTYDSNKMAADW